MTTGKHSSSFRVSTGIAMILLLGAHRGHAQAPDCTYDRCALRLHAGLFRGQLVQGRNAERVAGLGLFPPHIGLLAQASDSAQGHYRSFRSAQTTGASLGLVGAVAMTIGLLIVADQGRSAEAGSVLFFSGAALTFGGGLVLRGATNHLSQAVWWYNRGIRREP